MKKRLIAEFIGTYFLVFAGPDAIIIDAHFNPAVTIGFWLRGDVTSSESLYYIVIQFVAATAASCTLYLLFGNIAYLGATIPISSERQAFVLEFILTFVLMLVILGSAVHGKATKSFAGIAIGGTVGLMAMFAGPISGASMNPARSFGPAIVSGETQHLWLYLVASILGAATATLAYKFLDEQGD